MADTLLSSQAGQVVSIADNALPVRFRIDGWGGFSALTCVITSLGLKLNGNCQFLNTMRDFLYVYSFGDLPADVIISGMAFSTDCADSSGLTGVDKLLQYYATNRVSKRQDAVAVAIGKQAPLYGFITGMAVDLSDPILMAAGFSMMIKAAPAGGTAAQATSSTIGVPAGTINPTTSSVGGAFANDGAGGPSRPGFTSGEPIA